MTETEKLYLWCGLATGVALMEFIWLIHELNR